MCSLLFSLLALPTSADSGPKPQITVSFENVRDENFYIALLLTHQYGNPTLREKTESMTEIEKAFLDYEAKDEFNKITGIRKYEGIYNHRYYTPKSFKLLLYYPETKTFISSGIVERYAFDSYYTVDLSGIEYGTEGADASVSYSYKDAILAMTKSYDYREQLISLAARMLITLAAELLLALLAFEYRGKRVFLLFFITNLVTQAILNVTVNIKYFYEGAQAFEASYVLLEFFIFVIEALIYALFLPRLSKKSCRRSVAVFYSLVANSLSFILGLYLSNVIPSIF